MLCFTRHDLRVLQELGGLNPLHLAKLSLRPERLRYWVIGSPEGMRSTINLRHVFTYVEQATWRQLVVIQPSGILIIPEQGRCLVC